jgi:hypothetical protein
MALGLARDLFPSLKRRARSGAAERRPQVQQALRFLAGQKQDVLDRLRADQRELARAGDRVSLAASRDLLMRAVNFSLDTAALCTHPMDGCLLVLSPGRGQGSGEADFARAEKAAPLQAHLIAGGRLVACFEAEDETQALERAAASWPDPPAADGHELADERGIVFRWLCGLGPEHKIVRLPAD